MLANTSYLFVPTEFTEPTVLGSRVVPDDSLKRPRIQKHVVGRREWKLSQFVSYALTIPSSNDSNGSKISRGFGI
jgi:hypothetical protein